LTVNRKQRRNIVFVFKRPLAAVVAGIITAFLGVALDAVFEAAWAAPHAALAF
jgi:hypothetical protein